VLESKSFDESATGIGMTLEQMKQKGYSISIMVGQPPGGDDVDAVASPRAAANRIINADD
jgi:hypothetical protein